MNNKRIIDYREKNKMNDIHIHHIILPSSSMSSIDNTNELRTNDYTKANKHSVLELVAVSALVIVIVLIFSKTLTRGIDLTIKNQDTMLCESAKISGNTEYLNKCKCFYEGKDISCIQ